MYTLSMLRAHISRLWADKRGATAIEYAMIAAGVGGAIAASIYSLGSSIQNNLYNKLVNLL